MINEKECQIYTSSLKYISYHYIKIKNKIKVRLHCATALTTTHAFFFPIIPPNKRISHQ